MHRDLAALFRVGSLAGLSDGEILERLRDAHASGDAPAAELAMTALIERHSSMVWGVCRGLAPNVQDAEDAFQATFLILARKAGTLRVRETAGPWLHVVAHRTARGLQRAAARRRTVERAAALQRREAADAERGHHSNVTLDKDIIASVHAEILKLPGRSRVVVVLCDLEGLSYLEAARRLNVPLGTVQSRLARARQRLRRGLARRGIGGPAILEGRGGALGTALAIGLPHELARQTARLGSAVALKASIARAAASGPVQILIQRGIRTMFAHSLKRAALGLVGGALVVGAAWRPMMTLGQAPSAKGPPQAAQAPPEAPPKPKSPAEIPAPQNVRAAAGSGTILLYAVGADGERIPSVAEDPNGPYREIEKDVCWAVVTGTIDHGPVQRWAVARGLTARTPARGASLDEDPRRVYRMVEMERATLQPDGGWSDWEAVDWEPSLEILDRLPHREQERATGDVLVDNLVDPLPHLVRGRWIGVNVGSMVPAPGQPAGRKARGQRPRKTKAPEPDRSHLMLRTLDFTAEGGKTYRYRSRVVLFNIGREKGEPMSQSGPWSGPTNSVLVPARGPDYDPIPVDLNPIPPTPAKQSR